MKFADERTNTLYLARSLSRYDNVFNSLIATKNNIKINFISGTKNIWARDYMPLQVEKEKFVKFNYKGYGDEDSINKGLSYNQYPQLVVPDSCWSFLNPTISSIVLDGGNIIRYDCKVIITDIVFKHNPNFERENLIKELESLLDAEIIVIPAEPFDDLGHSDGICKFVDEKTIYMNDYRIMKQTMYDDYMGELISIFKKHKLRPLAFPYAYNKCPRITETQFRKKYPDADDFNPGFGYYINYLQMKDKIFLPIFNIKEDEGAIKVAEQYLDLEIIPIDCADLSMEGGLLNCVTANYDL